VGVFKRMKDIDASSAGTSEPAPRAAPGGAGPDFEPIAGVSLELYVEISKGVADYSYDQDRAVDVAASKGVGRADWSAAVNGWNARMRSNPDVGRRFNALYAAA
jgi:hypothetical protein